MPTRRSRLSNRPLLDTRTDAELFVGRVAELSRLTRALELGLNVLVSGPAGVGKTSLLRQLAWRLRDSGSAQPAGVRASREVPAQRDTPLRAGPSVQSDLSESRHLAGEGQGVSNDPYASGGRPQPTAHYIPAAPASTVGELLGLVGRALGVDEVADAAAGWSGSVGRDTDPIDQLALLAKALSGSDPTRPQPAVLLDEPSLDLATTLFGRLRDEVWQVPLTWVVGLDDDAAAALARPPADAFFEMRLELDTLAPAELRAMLDRRLPPAAVPEEVLDELVVDAGPRQVLDAARRLLTGSSWAELKQARHERAERIGRLGRPARMAIHALEELGGSASASDPELLERLGWSRARAVQVLGALEDAGVLVADTVRSRGAGRPRKVYRLRTPGAA